MEGREVQLCNDVVRVNISFTLAQIAVSKG